MVDSYNTIIQYNATVSDVAILPKFKSANTIYTTEH